MSLMHTYNFVNGEWIKPSGSEIEIFSPLDGKKIGSTYESTNSDLIQIITSAQNGFKIWSEMPLKERTQIMFKFRDLLLRDIEKIAKVITLENGKLIAESKAGIMKGVEVLEFALSLQNLDIGGRMEVSRGVACEFNRVPLGIVASITPFNFPAMVPMWTIPIALTLGNAFIWKPSDKTPLTAKFIADLLNEAGLPKGVFSVLNGGASSTQSLIAHPEVKAISFVGSTKIAKIVYQEAAKYHKRVIALGGAKNHIFLLPDANLEITVQGIVDSFTGCAGQRCMAASVLLAVGSETAPLIEKIKNKAASIQLGTQMGAIITKAQVEFLHGAIERAEKNGAKIILDGRKAPAPIGFEGGNWLGPTIIDFVTKGSEAQTTELFGPVLSIIHCKNITEAIEIENSSQYGNAASVFTQNGALAEFVIKNSKSAMCGVNIGVPVPREPFSFGGMNESKFGHGDITGEHSLDFWSHVKKITTKWQTQNDSSWMS